MVVGFFPVKSLTRMVHLKAAIQAFEALAPSQLAADWDNTGLLVEPALEDGETHDIKKIVVTNDLSLPVYEEARKLNASLVYSYHPLLFRPVKTLTMSTSWTVGVAMRCIKNNIAVYCPHTAIDAIPGGNNDWLLDAFSDYGITSKRPIEPASFKKLPVTPNLFECIALVKNAPIESMPGAKILKQNK